MKFSRNGVVITVSIVFLLAVIFGGGLTYGRAMQQQAANEEVAVAEEKAAALQSKLEAAQEALAQTPLTTAGTGAVTEGDVIGIRMWHEECAYSDEEHGVNCPRIRAEVLLLDVDGRNARTSWSEIPPEMLMRIDWSWHCNLETSACEPPV